MVLLSQSCAKRVLLTYIYSPWDKQGANRLSMSTKKNVPVMSDTAHSMNVKKHA